MVCKCVASLCPQRSSGGAAICGVGYVATSCLLVMAHVSFRLAAAKSTTNHGVCARGCVAWGDACAWVLWGVLASQRCVRSFQVFWKHVDGSCPTCGEDVCTDDVIEWFGEPLALERRVPTEEDVEAGASEGMAKLRVRARCCVAVRHMSRGGRVDHATGVWLYEQGYGNYIHRSTLALTTGLSAMKMLVAEVRGVVLGIRCVAWHPSHSCECAWRACAHSWRRRRGTPVASVGLLMSTLLSLDKKPALHSACSSVG